MREGPPVRSYLYVPGTDPRRIEKALASEADAVIVDLEDAVAAGRKEEARGNAVAVLESGPSKPLFVRINAPGSALADADLEAVALPNLAGIRVPKIESAADVRRVAHRLQELRCGAGIHCLIESALGLEFALEVAFSHERVAALSLGEADLAADLGVVGDAGLLYARSRLVAAARAAGLPRPAQSVYTAVRDLDGLRRTSEEGKRLGFFGRAAIHPAQLPIINEVFTPTAGETAEAEALLDRLEVSAGEGTGAFVLEDGRFVDEAVVRSARFTLAAARRSTSREEIS